jgi:lipoprotein-anchoring transpeptidase ErfK/SrfK
MCSPFGAVSASIAPSDEPEGLLSVVMVTDYQVEDIVLKNCWLLLGALALVACKATIRDENSSAEANATSPIPSVAGHQSNEFATVAEEAKSPFDAGPVFDAQVALDRISFSSGVIDGKEGKNYSAALGGFQNANGLSVTGQLDEATSQALKQQSPDPATRRVQIPADFARGPFTPDIPKDPSEQAKLSQLQYRDLAEALAERFHTTPQTLISLNPPGNRIESGAAIRVPNIPNVDQAQFGKDERGWNETLVRLGVAPTQPAIAKVVVDKSDGVLRAFAEDDKLIAQFPATMGSEHDPPPIGTWKIQGVSRNPDFHYNPDLFWDAGTNDRAVTLKPGPNGPVGVVWIDISKPHYGIHGTSEPSTIGRAESHGCIRLTNWDAARLAQMVKPGIPAVFQE